MCIAAARIGAVCLAGASVIAFAAALGGCAHEPVALDVRSLAPYPTAPIARPIAFLHSEAFWAHQQTIEPYGHGYFLPLKTGEASDKALRATYARLFAVPREVESRGEFAAIAGADGLIVLLEPSIAEFHYLNASRRIHGPYYAEIEYRFSLTGAGGETIARWAVRGFGQYDLDLDARTRTKDSPPAPRGEAAMNAEAPRRAIEAATASFKRVPELIRWRRGQPVAGTDVAPERQVTQDAGPVKPAVQVTYPGAFMLRVERTPVPKPPKKETDEAAREPNLVAVRLTLENASTHRLALDPDDIEWDAGLPVPLEPLPAKVAVALVTRLPFGLVISGGPGLAALPAPLGALVSATELQRHHREFAAWSEAVTADMLADGIAPGGAKRTGLIYFQNPRDKEGGTLTVRIIDLDEALRYTLQIAMPHL